MAFDISSEIVFPMRLVSTKSLEVEITVRWPTDAEWLKRARARKVIMRKPRAGVNETVLPMPGPHDVELYESIKLNGAPAMTPAEADKVLNAMSRSEVTDVRLEGADAEVDMNVISGPVTLKLRIPTADEVIHLQRAAVRLLDLPFSQQEVRINPEPGGRLFDDCGGRSDDYPKGIPLTHKDTAVRAVIDYIDQRVGPQPSEPNF